MSGKLLAHPPALCNAVRRIALEAGEVILRYFDPDGAQSVWEKDDGSPVTCADREAEALIHAALADITPGVPMIGEEASAQGHIPDLSGTEYFWMVDPLDGTKEFIAGREEFTVNIALIRFDGGAEVAAQGGGAQEGASPVGAGQEAPGRRGVPILGVVYAPAKGELYTGCGPGTALRWLEETDSEKPVRTRKAPPEGLTVATSRSHGNAAQIEKFLSEYKVAKLLRSGSSLKICAIAAGKADLYPRLGPTSEWDTAAGDAVLRAAGGRITDLDGAPLVYGRAERKFINPPFLARSGDV